MKVYLEFMYIYIYEGEIFDFFFIFLNKEYYRKIFKIWIFFILCF